MYVHHQQQGDACCHLKGGKSGAGQMAATSFAVLDGWCDVALAINRPNKRTSTHTRTEAYTCHASHVSARKMPWMWSGLSRQESPVRAATHAHTHARTRTRTHTCARAHAWAHTCAHLGTHTHACNMHVQIHISTQLYLHLHTYPHISTHAHTIIPAPTHIHTRMHTHTRTPTCTTDAAVDVARSRSDVSRWSGLSTSAPGSAATGSGSSSPVPPRGLPAQQLRRT